MPLLLAMMSAGQIGMVVLLVLGFGFVIFWHELGHFLAAKWVGIKVEQFAVGFGQAVFAWRKGIGFRLGNTQKDYRQRIEQVLVERQRKNSSPPGAPIAGGANSAQSAIAEKPEFSDAEISAVAEELGLGETEYRLNWIPLGGYVKMLGQDDLKPDALADDPRAFNRKSVGARMLVISAGVIMNVILAGIMFMILFRWGFNVAPAWVGNLMPDSPAQKAGLHVGDRIVTFDGKSQEDFTKILLNMALVKEGAPISMKIERPDPASPGGFKEIALQVTPGRAGGDKGFLGIGFEQPRFLEGLKKEETGAIDKQKLHNQMVEEAMLVQPGDVITAVNGQPVSIKDFVRFDQVLQTSHGQPISLTIRNADGVETPGHMLQPHFDEPFSGHFNLAGMVPRVALMSLTDDSPALGKLMPGDVVESLTDNDVLPNPSREKLMDRLGKDGESGQPFKLQVIRNGKSTTIEGLKATARLGEGRRGLGVMLMLDEAHPVIADVSAGSPAEQAGLKGGDLIRSIDGNPVASWYDLARVLSGAEAGASLKVVYERPGVDQPRPAELKLTAPQLAELHDIRYGTYLSLREYTEPRKTTSLVTAAKWGASETRDFILQFYLTLRRMVGGSVSPSNMMGPVGIFIGGARFAQRGGDWLLWFLAMISANLAVVNFLPIPVVDGGQFVFLILEKIKGKPLSPKTMAIAQYVGLAFLAGVVLFVTWHDLTRRY